MVVGARARRGEVVEPLADEREAVSGYGDGAGEVLIPLLVGVLGVRGMVLGMGMSAGGEGDARMAGSIDKVDNVGKKDEFPLRGSREGGGAVSLSRMLMRSCGY